MLLILLLIVAIAALVYWVKSLIIMKNNASFLTLGILFSPIPQIIYFFTQRNDMDDTEITTMKRFFMVMGAYFVLAIIYAFSAASQASVAYQ